MRELVAPEWFHGQISFEMAERRLLHRQEGTFLIRLSSNKPGHPFTLSVLRAKKVAAAAAHNDGGAAAAVARSPSIGAESDDFAFRDSNGSQSVSESNAAPNATSNSNASKVFIFHYHFQLARTFSISFVFPLLFSHLAAAPQHRRIKYDASAQCFVVPINGRVSRYDTLEDIVADPANKLRFACPQEESSNPYLGAYLDA